MKHILCDVDGVVVHGFHYDPARQVSWMTDLKEDLGICPKEFEQKFFFDLFPDVVVGKISIENALTKVLPEVGFGGNPEDVVSYWLRKDACINRDFLDWVDKNTGKNQQFYLATNQEHRRADYLWNNMDLKRRFLKMFYAADIGYKKPDVRFFEHVIEVLGVDPRDIILIDDHPGNVDVARSLGMSGIVFNDMSDIVDLSF